VKVFAGLVTRQKQRPIPGEPTTHNSEAIPHLAKDTQNRCHELGGSKPEVAKEEEHFNSYAIKEVGPAKD
jgi:hypothetical protein